MIFNSWKEYIFSGPTWGKEKKPKPERPTGEACVSFKGRQQANAEILAMLVEAVTMNPQLRFGQILAMYDVTQTVSLDLTRDIFNDESTEILSRMAKAKERLDA